MAHRSRRQSKSWTHRVSAAPDAVFPLLCPRREYEWIEVWDCDMVYSESGFAENGCIFKTHDPEPGESIWTVSRYEPANGRIEFVIVDATTCVQKLDIRVVEAGEGSSDVHWTRTITSVTPQGDPIVDGLIGAEFDANMAALGAMLEHYCTTGEMLPAKDLH